MPSAKVPASSSEAILQIKVHLRGISPMIWRRVLVPDTYTLRELHGVIQVAMGWEGIHLFEFKIRAVGYASWELCGESPEIPLKHFRFRKNAKFTYLYDMGDSWEHEIRIEDRQLVDENKHYPICTGGSGACPPEDCGGIDGYLSRRDAAFNLDTLEDISLIADFVDQVILKDNYEPLKDEDQRWAIECALDRCRAREPYQDDSFSRRSVNNDFREQLHQQRMYQCF